MSVKSDKQNKEPVKILQKRRAAKYLMTASMAALVYTGLKKGRSSKSLHIISGIALMGLSAYHTSLYNLNQRS